MVSDVNLHLYNTERMGESILRQRLRVEHRLRTASEHREAVLINKIKGLEYRQFHNEDQHEAFGAMLRACHASNVTIKNNLGQESPSLHLLMREQMQNLNCEKHGHRWHPLILKWALGIFEKGAAAYEAVAESGFLTLPHISTLKRLVRGCRQAGGIVHDHIHRINDSAKAWKMGGAEREMIMMIDEVGRWRGAISTLA